MVNPKERLAHLFLGLITNFRPLLQARLATLGGEGIEAKVWRERGIPPNHGWLIELNHRRANSLIRNHPYRNHNRLSTFAQILQGTDANSAQLDGFHLDLSGTLGREVAKELARIFPLILASRARCFAVTVADQRRNITLEQWPQTMRHAYKLLGEYAEQFYKTLVVQQEHVPVKQGLPAFMKAFDPTKGAKREFGLLLELLELLRGQSGFAPTIIERYLYVSRYKGRPFRMRTYFFHFEPQHSSNLELFVAEKWIQSSLFFLEGEEFVQINASTAEAEQIQKGLVMTSRLGDLARALGGAELEEYETLQKHSESWRQLQAVYEASKGMQAPQRQVVEMPATPPPVTKKVKRVWSDLTQREQIEVGIAGLELKAKTGGQWEDNAWGEFLMLHFGHDSVDLRKSIRSALARTSGGFREGYISRIKHAFGDRARPYLDRLSKIPVPKN